MEDENSRNEWDVEHEKLINITLKTLNDILKQDRVLDDLPTDVTLDEVTSQIKVQFGQAMTVFVVRDDGEEIPIVVPHKGTRVSDLKREIRRQMTVKLEREGIHKKISWRHIWKTNHLVFDNERLKDDTCLLSDYGIRKKSKITFAKKQREKGVDGMRGFN